MASDESLKFSTDSASSQYLSVSGVRDLRVHKVEYESFVKSQLASHDEL